MTVWNVSNKIIVKWGYYNNPVYLYLEDSDFFYNFLKFV